MKKHIEQRVRLIAEQMLEKKYTVRKLAENNFISKSTVHKDLTERLPLIDRKLYQKVRKILDYNKSQRAIRGGLATKTKYENMRKLKAKKEG